MRFVGVLTLLLLMLGASSALAAPAAKPKGKPADDRPAGTHDSIAMTVDQMYKDLQFLVAQKYGTNVHYVLPKGWEIVEQTREGKTDKQGRKVPGVYTVVSRRKMADPKEPTDFIFELDIYQPDILADMATNLSQDEETKQTGLRFKSFLDAQLKMNLQAGFKCLSTAGEISPKLYGPDGTRPKTTFVPIRYRTKEGALLYTFTSLTGGQVWQLKFLVSKDQEKNYEGLITILVNSAFALTDKQFQEVLKNTKAVQDRGKSKGSAKPKGK
jgi:hypothetical protein